MGFESVSGEDRSGAVQVRATFEEDQLRVRETPFGLALELEGCTTFGLPGEPALPRTSIHVAVPEGMWPTGVEVEQERVVRLTDEPTPVMPVQPLRPGVAQHDGGRPPDDDEDDFVVEPFPAPPLVPPDPELYAQAAKDPRTARPTGLSQIGRTPIIRIELRPVRLTEAGLLELTTELELRVTYGPRPKERLSPEELKRLLEEKGVRDLDFDRLEPLPEPKTVSRGQARRNAELARSLVVNHELVHDDWRIYPFLDLPAEYLIITDNQTWDANAIAPMGSVAGDMVAEFFRLADWKRSRGLTTKVVTVTDIVDGRYGDFRTGSRDLPEVIRRFLKDVYERWGVAWVLLGGDVSVVPPRLAAGALEGHMDVATDDPPEDNKSFWNGSFLEMHVVSPGTWWPGGWQPILVNAGTGQLIPFDATGATATAGLGWYYTTDETYTTRAATATQFVRVNGPAAVTNARLQWLYQWNRIPTDFYYASLWSWVLAYHEIDFWLGTVQIPYVYVPDHDWDALDNGLYGQYHSYADVDGVHWQADVSVGRAPVQSAAEAQVFVDKVIAYESYGGSGGLVRLSGTWPQRLLILSSNWGGGVSITATVNDPPGNNRYHARADVTVIKLEKTPESFDLQLIAEISDSDRRELPWEPSNAPGSRGWHYARSDSDHTLNTIEFAWPWGPTISFPWPSQWIVVHGPAEERNPPSYLLDPTGQDGSMADQETLREQLAVELPGWSAVSRLYKDETDLTPAQAAAAPIAHLTSDRVEDALNAGPHIVSLSGHGSGGGCCGAGIAMAAGLTNGPHAFIAYADSCLTNQIDMEDAFSEALIKNADGGAVAYIGNTRFSWIGLGDDHQRAFFHRLASTRHLGLLNDIRAQAVDMAYWHAYARWAVFALNLIGDPEMPVWRKGWRRFRPEIYWERPHLKKPIKVKFKKPKPGEPVEDVFVHLRQGDFERLARPDRDGVVTLDLTGARAGELTLTVSAPDTVPFVRVLMVEGPEWLTGRVRSVSHREDGRESTSVFLETEEGSRRLVAARDDGDHDVIVDAAVQACVSGKEISFLVESDQDGGRIERFHLHVDVSHG
jgi:Peptidase family C25